MSVVTDHVTVDADGLEQFTRAALEAAGADPASAAAGAQVLTRTSLRGVDSHGVWFLERYVRQLREGGALPRPEPTAVADRGALLVLDGEGGLGLATAHRATTMGIARARQHGMATIAVRNGNHFGAAGHYALMCAEAGCIGLMMSNTPPIMAATGARTRSVGNSPLGFGAPRTQGPPLVLDIAMSRVAGGKIRMALARGEAVPEGWILDPDGNPTTDPADFLVHRGALLPMEQHKGYGLSLMVETLAGALSGAALLSHVGNWLYTPETPSGTGFFLMVIDVGADSAVAGFDERMRGLCDEVVSAPLAPGADRILIPGELEHEREQRARASGLELRNEIWTALAQVADDLGLGQALEQIRR